MAQLGFRTLAEMVGQTHKINSNKAVKHYKAKGLDLSSILHRPTAYKSMIVKNTEEQDHNLENVLDFAACFAAITFENIPPEPKIPPVFPATRSNFSSSK